MQGRSAVTLIAIAVVVGALFALFAERTPEPIGPGHPAPLFSLPSLSDNKPVALETLRGRVVLLHFWATWCKPCEEEMPALERLRHSLDSDRFALLTVSADEDRSQVESYRDRLKLSLPILLDPSHEVSRAYQTYRYPESFLLDREGKVVSRFVGPREWDSEIYVDRIRELLGGEPRPKTEGGPALSDARGAR
ncbi:MAG TPA: TlpA family protein disulfide reductase [Deltaproteobacteria bacterium]|jgi:peroxiredoxin|nr:TlpA family protein disulfide reductase [Deltaproteobacteria bacterium]